MQTSVLHSNTKATVKIPWRLAGILTMMNIRVVVTKRIPVISIITVIEFVMVRYLLT